MIPGDLAESALRRYKGVLLFARLPRIRDGVDDRCYNCGPAGTVPRACHRCRRLPGGHTRGFTMVGETNPTPWPRPPGAAGSTHSGWSVGVRRHPLLGRIMVYKRSTKAHHFSHNSTVLGRVANVDFTILRKRRKPSCIKHAYLPDPSLKQRYEKDDTKC